MAIARAHQVMWLVVGMHLTFVITRTGMVSFVMKYKGFLSIERGGLDSVWWANHLWPKEVESFKEWVDDRLHDEALKKHLRERTDL